jgi:hypothetical protein
MLSQPSVCARELALIPIKCPFQYLFQNNSVQILSHFLRDPVNFLCNSVAGLENDPPMIPMIFVLSYK